MGLPRQATQASRGGETTTGGPATEAAATLTRHARRRGAQSNLCERDLEIVRMYGVLEHRTGVRFYFVRRREVERFQRAEPRLARLQGVVMVESNEAVIITVYRNRKALKEIRRKSKYQQGQAA